MAIDNTLLYVLLVLVSISLTIASLLFSIVLIFIFLVLRDIRNFIRNAKVKIDMAQEKFSAVIDDVKSQSFGLKKVLQFLGILSKSKRSKKNNDND